MFAKINVCVSSGSTSYPMTAANTVRLKKVSKLTSFSFHTEPSWVVGVASAADEDALRRSCPSSGFGDFTRCNNA